MLLHTKVNQGEIKHGRLTGRHLSNCMCLVSRSRRIYLHDYTLASDKALFFQKKKKKKEV